MPQKFKSAILLLVMMVVVLISCLLEKGYIRDFNQSFSTLYKDRLIPATDVFLLSDHLYNKRLLLEKFLLAPELQDPKKIKSEIKCHNQKIDSLIQDFELTYLVDAESKSLKNFKVQVNEYNAFEKELLKDSNEMASGTMRKQNENLSVAFQNIRKELVALSEIQTTVGRQILRGSESTVAHAMWVNHVQILLIIIIGLVIQGLVVASKGMVPRKPQNPHLN